MRVALLLVALACTVALVSGIPISMMESRTTAKATLPGAGEECSYANGGIAGPAGSATPKQEGACMTAAACKKFSKSALTNICAGNLVCCISSAGGAAAPVKAQAQGYYNVREKNVDPNAPKVNSGRFAKKGAATAGPAAPTAPASTTTSTVPASGAPLASTPASAPAPAAPSSAVPVSTAPVAATPTGQACDYSHFGWCPAGQTCFTYPGGQVTGGSGHYCGPSYAVTPTGPWGVKMVGADVCHGCMAGCPGCYSQIICCSYPPAQGKPAHYCGNCRSS